MTINKRYKNVLQHSKMLNFVNNKNTQALLASKRKTAGTNSCEYRKKNIPLLVGEHPDPYRRATLNVTIAVRMVILSQNVLR